MGACVLLLHELSDGDSHYDWLIDPSQVPPPSGGAEAARTPDERSLLAFRLTDRIDLALPPPPPRFHALRLPDHRRLYLTWEGVLSGGRGRVSRLAEGHLRIEAASPSRLLMTGRLGATAARFSGVQLRDQTTGDRWLFSTAPADALV